MVGDTALEAPGDRTYRPLSGLSPSRASDFMACPLLFRFRTIDRLPEPPGPAAARGTLVHSVLERLFDLPANARTPDTAAALLPEAWAALVESDPDLATLADGPELLSAWFDDATTFLQRYFGMEDPRRLEPAQRELYVETTLESGLVLRGYVDRLDESPAGDLRVVDYKTGNAPGEGFEARPLFQMRFYALVLWRMRGVVPRRLQLMYLGSGEVVSYEPDEADLLATERKVLALWQAISDAYETGDWQPNPGRICDWCAHKALCPAWGGTPPPLPARASGDDDHRAEVVATKQPILARLGSWLRLRRRR